MEKSSCKVFVGGIEGTVTTEELKDFFQGYGDVKEAVVLRNITTNASRGFGFVTFEDSRVADNLIKNNNCVLKGKRMDIKPAEPKDSSNPRPQQPSSRRDYPPQDMPPRRGGGMGRDHGGYGPPPVDPYHKQGYQRGYNSRDKYAPEYDYVPSHYDQYAPQSRAPSRYQAYGAPPPMEPTPVATIAPYAPPAPPSYGSYGQQPVYGYGQPQMPQEPKVPSYGASSSYTPADTGYSRGGYREDIYALVSSKEKDTKYSKPSYGQMNQSQPTYGQYGNKGGNDPYMAGPSRDYGNQNKNHRYKPY